MPPLSGCPDWSIVIPSASGIYSLIVNGPHSFKLILAGLISMAALLAVVVIVGRASGMFVRDRIRVQTYRRAIMAANRMNLFHLSNVVLVVINAELQ